MTNDELTARIMEVTDRPDVIGLIFQLRTEWNKQTIRELDAALLFDGHHATKKVKAVIERLNSELIV